METPFSAGQSAGLPNDAPQPAVGSQWIRGFRGLIGELVVLGGAVLGPLRVVYVDHGRDAAPAGHGDAAQTVLHVVVVIRVRHQVDGDAALRAGARGGLVQGRLDEDE